MAIQKEIKKILETINLVLEELDIQDTIADENLHRKVETGTPEEFLYKNAEIIDVKKLLLIEIQRLEELAKRYHGTSTMLEKNMIQDRNRVKELAKKYMKQGEEVTVFAQVDKDMPTERYEIISSENLVYDRPMENQNSKYDTYKEILPEADLIDVRNMYDILEQMLGDKRLARILNNQVIQKTFYEQGVGIEKFVDIFDKNIYEMMKEVEKIVDISIYNQHLKKQLEKNKRYFNADKYVLYKIYKQQVKCENGESLTEEEKQFLASISKLIKDIQPEERINLKKFNDKQFRDDKKYGVENVRNFLSRINIESGEYITEEQIRSGERFLSETNGYEEFLKKRELKRLAENEQNLAYLAHKKVLQRPDILSILTRTEVTKETLIQIYQDEGITLEDIEGYAKRTGLDFEEIKADIRKVKEIDFTALKEGNSEHWKLLTLEERKENLSKIIEEGIKAEIGKLIQNQIITPEELIVLYKEGHGSIDIIQEFVSLEEIQENLNIEEIAQKYKEIYVENYDEKREEYKRLIALYNVLGKENSDEIIGYLEEELSNDMLTNLYRDNAINLNVLQGYGGVELVESLYQNGNIHNTDILKVIEMIDVQLNEGELIQYYTEGIMTSGNMIELYLKGKIELEQLKKINEELEGTPLENDLSDSELLALYQTQKKTKKREDSILYKKYGLLFQTLKLAKMEENEKHALEEKIVSENGDWLHPEDLKELYKMNILSMETVQKYGGQEEIDELIISGELKTSDTKKLFADSSEEKLTELEAILKNSQMKDIQKLILIYSTFDDNKEMRDRLVNYLGAHATDVKGENTGEKREESKGKIKDTGERETVTDPYERWRLFSLLDENYTKEYVDGYVMVGLPKLQKTVIEKMLKEKNGKTIPARGVATFSMGIDKFEEIKDEIITPNERLDISKVRKIVKENENMDKTTHHPPVVGKDGREITSWGKRILNRLVGEQLKEIYTQEEVEEIEECLKRIEASREEIR